MAARQLPSDHVGDPRHPPAPAGHLLPAAADAGVARAGRSHAHLRDGRRAAAPQRQPHRPSAADGVPQQLPARRAADDRRALGVAEHAEAGADREPPAAGRGDAGSRAAARLAADAYVSRIEREAGDTAQPLPSPLDVASVVQLLHRVREYGLRLSSIRTAVEEHLAVAGDDRGSGDSRRAPAAGRGPGVGGQCHHQPAPVLGARLAPVCRIGQPGRAGAAARSGRRLRADGFPQPRSAAPGGRGAAPRRAARRRCGSRCERSRAPARRPPPARPPIAPPTSAIT